MSKPQFLLLEDKPLDIEVIQTVLTNGGIDCELSRVDTRAAFATALETAEFDLILAAYAMPGFDGLAALRVARELRPEVPFIFVSASLGEELAIETLKQGATDYVLKQRLERLVPCVQRALREAQERREHEQAEVALRQNEARLRAVAANLPNAAVFLVDRNFRYLLAEGKALEDAGMTAENFVGKTLWEALDPALATRYKAHYRQALDGEPFQLEHRSHDRDYISHGTPLYNAQGEVDTVLVVSYDMSDRKRVEDERKQAEVAQRESEERYRTLFESINEGFCVVEVLFDPAGTPCDHRILQANPAFERQTGIVSPEGKMASDLAPGLEKYWNDFYAQVIHTGEPIRVENRSDALDRWFDVLVSRVGDGALHQVAIMFSDITDRKRAENTLRQTSAELERQLRKLDAIAASVPDFIYTFDLAGRFTYISQSLLDLWQKTSAEAMGKNFFELDYPDDLAARLQNQIQQVIETCQPIKDETPYTSAVGTRAYEYIFVPMLDATGAVEAVAGVTRDITRRKQAEIEREHLLAQEQAAREAAETANRIKDEFLAVLSHELRSPLNPILGWTQLLQNGKLNASRQAEALKTIERNAKLQSQLIEDLLDISRIMQGKLSLTATPVSLTFVISAALETVRLAAEAKHIQITLALDTVASVSGDVARLQQVVWNLLTNAIKFTPKGGQVTVELRQTGRLAQLRVIDTGKGIAPDFLLHVFEYFRQEDGSTTRKFGGLGLGLAIVRQIVEMHGGTVWAESQGENQGATFVVQLPILPQVAPIPPGPLLTQVDAEAPLNNVHILLVDDEPDAREFEVFLLEQSGAKVTAVASGLEALQVLDQFIPAMLVSDVGMAEMDGYMLIQQIRSRPPNQGGTIPAIALTAYAADIDQQKALQVGFQAHITKPVEPEVLVQAIVGLWARPTIAN